VNLAKLIFFVLSILSITCSIIIIMRTQMIQYTYYFGKLCQLMVRDRKSGILLSG